LKIYSYSWRKLTIAADKNRNVRCFRSSRSFLIKLKVVLWNINQIVDRVFFAVSHSRLTPALSIRNPNIRWKFAEGRIRRGKPFPLKRWDRTEDCVSSISPFSLALCFILENPLCPRFCSVFRKVCSAHIRQSVSRARARYLFRVPFYLSPFYFTGEKAASGIKYPR